MSGKTYPLISVGIPTFNGAHRIEKALSSLLNQDYPNLEIIISDNASLDNTRELCESYSRENSKIVYHRQARNLGLMPNFEYLMHVAKGKYFMFLSDDDSLAPDILTNCVEFLEANEDHAMVCGRVNHWRGEELFDFEAGLDFSQPSPLIRSLKVYYKMKFSGLIHGMFRLENGRKLRLKSIFANDWHFLAALAYTGKITQLKQVGYEKSGEGSSSDFHRYARTMGESFIWGYMPFIKIALDAFREIFYRERVFRKSLFPLRLLAAISASGLVLFRHYGNTTPRIWAGKVLRMFKVKTPREKRLEQPVKEYFPQGEKAILE